MKKFAVLIAAAAAAACYVPEGSKDPPGKDGTTTTPADSSGEEGGSFIGRPLPDPPWCEQHPAECEPGGGGGDDYDPIFDVGVIDDPCAGTGGPIGSTDGDLQCGSSSGGSTGADGSGTGG